MISKLGFGAVLFSIIQPAMCQERRANIAVEEARELGALKEFIGWYNRGGVHHGLNAIPDPDPAINGPKPVAGRLVAIPVPNGLHQDYRLAA